MGLKRIPLDQIVPNSEQPRKHDEETAIDAIIENLARADLTVMEEANAFQRMLDHGYSVERLARELASKRTASGIGSSWSPGGRADMGEDRGLFQLALVTQQAMGRASASRP